MTAPPFTVRKLDAGGHEVWRYPARVVERGPAHIVLEAIFDRDDVTFHGLRLERGDRFLETFYTDRWYNVFAIHDRDSDELKGWYCNVARPAKIGQEGLEAEDLALDLVVHLDGTHAVLDEDEFEALPLSAADHLAARQALEELKRMAPTGQGPFGRRSP